MTQVEASFITSLVIITVFLTFSSFYFKVYPLFIISGLAWVSIYFIIDRYYDMPNPYMAFGIASLVMGLLMFIYSPISSYLKRRKEVQEALRNKLKPEEEYEKELMEIQRKVDLMASNRLRNRMRARRRLKALPPGGL